jgi:hypothetical protein
MDPRYASHLRGLCFDLARYLHGGVYPEGLVLELASFHADYLMQLEDRWPS